MRSFPIQSPDGLTNNLLAKADSQAYTCNRRILIQVLPPPNVYTKSANACIPSLCQILCNKDAYMHEQTTKGFGKINTCIRIFGIHIGRRKYLNEYTHFTSVSLWIPRCGKICGYPHYEVVYVTAGYPSSILYNIIWS